jgi:hypothetical protein
VTISPDEAALRAVAEENLRDDLVDERHGLIIVPTSELRSTDRDRMFGLLRTCYGNVSRDQFESDLGNKQWVLLGSEPGDGSLWMFSTGKQFDLSFNGERTLAFYSGDTASAPEKRGGPTSAGIRLVVRRMYQQVVESPDTKCYWFMISSTFKSYRLLSLLYEDFAPRPGRPLEEDEKLLIATLSRMQGYSYEPVRSICRLPNPSVPTEDSEQGRGDPGFSDPLAAYFAAMNSGANRGDRLASLTRLTMTNLNAVGRKFVMGDFARQIG